MNENTDIHKNLHRDVDEFTKFNELLTANAPEGYEPFYFRCEPNGKDPYTKVGSWLKNPLTLKEAVGWLKEGGNVGIAGLNEDPLVIVDIDDETITDYKTLKTTLTTRSASRKGVHLFYFEDIPGSIPNIPTDDAGEIRADNQYVIATGSYATGYPDKVENIGEYTIEVAEPPATISLSEIPKVFKDQLAKSKEDKKKINAIKEEREGKHEEEKRSALFDLTIYDIVSVVPNPRERFPSLFHDSHTGKNTCIVGGLIHCFRHHVSLNALQALCVLSGYLTCMEAGSSHTGSEAGPSLVKGDDRAIFEAWKYAKDTQLIPENDPVPTKAMIYIATTEGFCKVKDIKDGWKLPLGAYNNVLAYLKDSGTEPGREKGEPKGKKKTKKEKHKEQQISDTAEIMEVLKQKYQFITAEDTQTIYYYRDGVYEEADRLIETEVERHFNITNSTYFTREIINHLRREKYTNRDKFNADKTRIPLKNGLFNLETFELEPFDENEIFTFRFPITYNADARCPNIEAWIKEIVNQDSLNLLQEFSGYGFVPRFPLHKTLWLHGSGRNGKGAFMRLYKKLIGGNGSTVPLEQMSANYRFAIIRLMNSFVNICSEPQSDKIFQTETFKKLTGGDEVEGEIKGLQKTVKFTAFTRIFIMGNRYPKVDDDTNGFWNRMEIVKFPNDYSKIAIPEIEEKKIIDDGGEEQALAGFFNWCISGLKRLKKNDYMLSESKSSEETRVEFEKVSNSVRAFISECVELESGKKIPQPTLYEHYKEYCAAFILEIQKKGVLTSRIGELRGVTLGKAKYDNKNQWVWTGLTFKKWIGGENYKEEANDDKKNDEKGGQCGQGGQTVLTHALVFFNDVDIDKCLDKDVIGEYCKNLSTLSTFKRAKPLFCVPNTPSPPVEVFGKKKKPPSNLSTEDSNLSTPKSEGLFCVCGKRFDTAEVLIGHQANCKEFQGKQDLEAKLQ